VCLAAWLDRIVVQCGFAWIGAIDACKPVDDLLDPTVVARFLSVSLAWPRVSAAFSESVCIVVCD
jgi:hypothetical protein